MSITEEAWSPYTHLTATQRDKLQAFQQELVHFNQRINLISQDTEAEFEARHLRHVLALTYRTFPDGSVIVDWGTGGGLPAIPLAICFPHIAVHAVDGVRKKIQAVRAIARRLELANLVAWHGRAEQWPGTAHYSVSRAAAPLADLWRWHRAARDPRVPSSESATWRPGLVCLKGGELEDEIEALRETDPTVQIDQYNLYQITGDVTYDDKYIMNVY